MLKNLVVYSSETGNTKLLAEEIYNSISAKKGSKKLVDVRSWNGTLDAENYFIGFWINRGSCSLEMIDLISSLHGKNVAFFGTCGLGNTRGYYRSLEQNARVWLPDDNFFLGSFFCQGKMPYAVREKYESYRGKCDDHKIDLMLDLFDAAMSHPDGNDLLMAHLFAENSLRNIPDRESAYV
ncbi:MAG: flavodoxin family protein [Butyrivibrio sp.]|nr:flavodoxin family protein [Butyrivibrio sp.]